MILLAWLLIWTSLPPPEALKIKQLYVSQYDCRVAAEKAIHQYHVYSTCEKSH